MNQLEVETEERKKEVEDLKTALQQKRTEAEENTKKMEELQAALDGHEEKLEERSKELEELKSELDELNKLLEEKSREADESMDKYCTLMVQVHKLEETNEALTTQLEQRADTTRRRRSARKSATKRQEEKLEDITENVAPSTPQRSPQGKRVHRDISDKDSAQEALHNLTKKLKANAVTTPKPRTEQEDEEFRPEGLPELVQKGACWVVIWVYQSDTCSLFSVPMYCRVRSTFSSLASHE